MHRILFICHGNICRSPMAEFAMKKIVADAGRIGEFEIASAAVSSEELGNPVYPPARRILEAQGIDCSAKRARQLTAGDAEHYDWLLVMDKSNLRLITRIIDRTMMDKVRLLGDFTPEKGEIEDPWYTGNFEGVWQQVLTGCRSFFASLGASER